MHSVSHWPSLRHWDGLHHGIHDCDHYTGSGLDVHEEPDLLSPDPVQSRLEPLYTCCTDNFPVQSVPSIYDSIGKEMCSHFSFSRLFVDFLVMASCGLVAWNVKEGTQGY